MTEFLAGIGALCMIAVICFLGICAYGALRQLVKKIVRRYRYKHRFDKPPTAKCYCIDCRRHDNDTKRCYRFKYESGYQCTADNWFCWDAEPKEETNGIREG